MMTRTTVTLSSIVLACICAAGSLASDWPHWRGPFYNGSTDEVNLPTTFSKTSHVRWASDLPGHSAATPVVCKDSVFVSSADQESNSTLALCFELAGGQLRWQHVVGTETRQDNRSTYAAPSPVTDGQVVVFFYGNGPMAAFDYAGHQLWKRNIGDDYGEFAFQWTFSSSPLLYEGKLYLQVLQRDVAVQGRGSTDGVNESYILALDPQTGRELWRVTRLSNAVAESREAFTSPIPFGSGDHQELLVVGGDCLTGHDPQSGKELWRWGTWNPLRVPHWRLVPSPVAGKGIVLACAPKSEPVYAIRAGGSGTLSDDAIAWTSAESRDITSDVPTPAFYDGDFFILSKKRRCVSRVEPETGEVKWTRQLQSRDQLEASPLAADGKIYMIDFGGLVTVLSADDGEILAEIPMGGPSTEPIRSSIVAAQGQLFIRTNDKLYCIAP